MEAFMAAINQIRQRTDVIMPPIVAPKNQDEMREIVRRERAVEFAFEGLHFFDIRRWKTAAKVIPGPVYGITYIANGQLDTIKLQHLIKSLIRIGIIYGLFHLTKEL